MEMEVASSQVYLKCMETLPSNQPKVSQMFVYVSFKPVSKCPLIPHIVLLVILAL
jgi:hypothetical protein